MNPGKQSVERVRELFSEARDLPDGATRTAFIQEACGTDSDLRQEVESLLDTLKTTGEFLNRDAGGKLLNGCSNLVGLAIGHYHLLELLGEGGFGEVYRALQLAPLKREVALKIVKLGMDTREVLVRFEAERQALARMDHPDIAQVYDAGVTESGRPYFVMELVRGIPLLEYCDRHRLSLPERIQLFRQVCDGVQHAHQKGVLHRDLKPSNILVGEENGRPLPKVIDFGVAKSLEGRLSDQTLVTMPEAVMGTPLYMSPEQLSLKNVDIDTRSDIYSLGIILYELVAGVMPLQDELPNGIFDMRRILETIQLPRPSKMFHIMGEKAETVAQNRQLKVQALAKLLHGDLNWVVMKSIEKERDRRYGDVGALSRDLEHYLKHEPISAGPPGLTYRGRKFIRRHRSGLVFFTGILLVVCIGSWISIISLVRALQESENARMQEVRAQHASERADEQEILAEATFGFLIDELLLRADPVEEPDRDIKLRTVVDQAAERLEQHMNGLPAEKARIHQMLGNLYLRLGEDQKARFHADKAVRLLQGLLPEEDEPVLLSCLHDQAEVMLRQGEYLNAEEQFTNVWEMRCRQLGAGHPDTLRTLRCLTAALYAQGRYKEAEEKFRHILEIQKMTIGAEHPESLQTLGGLARVLSGRGIRKGGGNSPTSF